MWKRPASSPLTTKAHQHQEHPSTSWFTLGYAWNFAFSHYPLTPNFFHTTLRLNVERHKYSWLYIPWFSIVRQGWWMPTCIHNRSWFTHTCTVLFVDMPFHSTHKTWICTCICHVLKARELAPYFEPHLYKIGKFCHFLESIHRLQCNWQFPPFCEPGARVYCMGCIAISKLIQNRVSSILSPTPSCMYMLDVTGPHLGCDSRYVPMPWARSRKVYIWKSTITPWRRESQWAFHIQSECFLKCNYYMPAPNLLV